MIRLLVLALAITLTGCGGDDDASRAATKSSPAKRAARRMYDGAPPVIPHETFNAACTSCHDAQGMAVDGVGFAPPMPHAATPGIGAIAHCRQCHLFHRSDDVFRTNTVAGLPQDLRKGDRMYDGAPPRMPHGVFMRENCTACHSGPAAREAIRCSHPERSNCLQCHLRVTSDATFPR